MKNLWNLWREYVAWPWRWVCYILVVVAVFYAAEDIRGGHAWKKFLKENPKYRYAKDSQSVRGGAASDFLFRRVNVVPVALRYYQSNHEFAYISVDRTREFINLSRPDRALEFPLTPFRRSGVWYPSALWKNGSQIKEDKASKIILGDGGLFEAFENKHGAEIRKRLVEGIPESEFDYEIKLYMRCLLWRSIAHLEFGETEKCLANLKRALQMLNQFDDGTSIIRSNDVVPDLMNCLQIIWQGINAKKIATNDLADLQKLIEAVAIQKSARDSAVHFAHETCRELDRNKWSITNRMEKIGQFPSTALVGSSKEKLFLFLGRTRWQAYLLLMPNGWLDHNKIHCCEESEFAESQPSLGRFSVLRSFAESQRAFVHRFDPRPAEAYLRCALTAIAAERYRIEMQKEPYSVKALIPEYLETVPLDPYQPEQPLVVDLEGSRPVIYSIGPNQKDDRGTPRGPIKDGDLVWRHALPDGFTYNEYILY